ncbi:Gluconokinase [Pseudonocardia sp. Ae168_Ps1]|uniref:gluconokinase n=1 Tax=unclassified Pseudonocardia TaxID=2619320 RepID=UPI0006CB02F4|nr:MULTISPECIES: gluconokinase [unclassified Pseudonocardia]ALE74834.1 gluconate kinase [Pseudonocardia sp. EC080625-04]OLL75905.1 Gluconokinase [Pseudonocardia sp. Ae150A_Ps1]OLL81904.1 Gluconokinase [Pseudonocardia sp. Ae168_Ps1]OLL83983.1 Gluconokinase [Pseudonocardia sp. Ae263_Ps1]OLL95997.1 Gluconokinase [Pseudonocardia sp. Ae356_Ps1]
MQQPTPRPPLVVVMGVSGSGKSTVGAALAERLGVGFTDADALHPAANVAKMHAGVALTDADREPWLDIVGGQLAGHAASGLVVACSALRRDYRDRLRRHAPATVFLHLAGDHDTLAARMTGREGHFMPPALLGSQLATLEPLGADETGATLDIARTVDELVEAGADAVTGHGTEVSSR